jgi:hypothetical protein
MYTALCDKVCQWIPTGCFIRIPPPINWLPRYYWTIVERGQQHNGQRQFIIVCRLWRFKNKTNRHQARKLTVKIHKIHTLYEYFYLIDLEIKYTIDTARSASYHDIHLEIGNEARLRKTRYDRKHDTNLPIVNFPITCSTIPAAPAYRI